LEGGGSSRAREHGREGVGLDFEVVPEGSIGFGEVERRLDRTRWWEERGASVGGDEGGGGRLKLRLELGLVQEGRRVRVGGTLEGGGCDVFGLVYGSVRSLIVVEGELGHG